MKAEGKRNSAFAGLREKKPQERRKKLSFRKEV